MDFRISLLSFLGIRAFHLLFYSVHILLMHIEHGYYNFVFISMSGMELTIFVVFVCQWKLLLLFIMRCKLNTYKYMHVMWYVLPV